MDENKPGEELPNVGPLILRAKYGQGEAACRDAGAKAVGSLREHGRYSAMIDLCVDKDTPPFLAEEARLNILAAAITACKNSGLSLPLLDVATRQDVPLEIAMHAGVFLVVRLSEPYDAEALRGVLTDRRFHDEARTEAGKAMMAHAEKIHGFSALFDLATAPEIMYDVKKPAGKLLIKMAVDQGNYPIIIALDAQKTLPVDIRIALEDKVEEAAKTAIELAYAENDFAILTDISNDKRLPVSVRDRALGCLHDTVHGKQAAPADGPDKQMTAELMFRLGKGAGAVRSSVAPPASAEHPAAKEPLGRMKR